MIFTIHFPDGDKTFYRLERCITWMQFKSAMDKEADAIILCKEMSESYNHIDRRLSYFKNSNAMADAQVAISAILGVVTGGLIPVAQMAIGKVLSSYSSNKKKDILSTFEGKLIIRSQEKYGLVAQLNDGELLIFRK